MLFHEIRQPALVDVDSKHLVINQAATKPGLGIGLRNRLIKTMDELLPDFLGNKMCLRRICVPEQHQRPEQHLPILPDYVENSPPINFALSAKDHVRNIGPIEPLPPG